MHSSVPASFAFTLLIAAVLPTALAAGIATFKACLPPGIPFHLPTSPSYANLKSKNFRNNVASPTGILPVRSERDVFAVVKCARKANLRICVRSGGHSLAGNSLCNGLLLDVGLLRSVTTPSTSVAKVGAGATLGELLWNIWQQRKRWVAAGVCPGVGVGGYVFGGGHGPYEGTLGMACDSLISVRVVDSTGKLRIASRKSNKDLFWALCGAGGGQLGVVTSFDIRTVSSQPYDRGVIFRFRWPQKVIGQLMHKWMDYGENGGQVWFRMEMNLAKNEPGMFGYGTCYNVDSTEACMNRLKKAAFFNTPGRTTSFLSKVSNALDLHAFFGPDGNYARKRASNLRSAMSDKRYIDQGQANARLYQSTFFTKKKAKVRPSFQFWQKYGDFCANPGRGSIPWVVCELISSTMLSTRSARMLLLIVVPT